MIKNNRIIRVPSWLLSEGMNKMDKHRKNTHCIGNKYTSYPLSKPVKLLSYDDFSRSNYILKCERCDFTYILKKPWWRFWCK
jgi:hypothetical protein